MNRATGTRPRTALPPARGARALIGALVALALGLLAAPAWAQPVGAGSAPGHVWHVLPDAETGGGVLLHAPPRRADDAARFRASEHGTLRVARRLTFMPVALTAGEDTVTLFAPPAPEGDEPGASRALSLRAVPTPMSDFWAYEPGGRFLPTLPLPGGLEIHAASSIGEAPVVLGRLDGRWWLAELGPEAWRAIELPDEAQRAERLVLTGPSGDPPALIDPGVGLVWRAWTIRPNVPGDGWGWDSVTLTARRPLADGAVFKVGQRWFVARFTPGGIDIATLDATDERHLASVAHAPRGAVIGVTGDHAGRLVGVWTREPTPGAPAGDDVELAEISLATGAELFRGEPVRVSPISAAQFRMLAAALVALAIIALLIVLGPGETPLVLPEGASLAEPARRLIATLVDLVIAAGACAAIFRVPLVDLLTLSVLFSGDGSWVALPATLGVGALAGTTLEWLVGCTLGKAATGCRVVSVRPADVERAKSRGRPAARALLWQAAVRNVIKWGLPPVAALALLDSSGRYRGDVLSRTAVILPPAPAPAPGD